MLFSSSPSVWVGLQVTSEADDSTALQIDSSIQALFFDKPAESKVRLTDIYLFTMYLDSGSIKNLYSRCALFKKGNAKLLP